MYTTRRITVDAEAKQGRTHELDDLLDEQFTERLNEIAAEDHKKYKLVNFILVSSTSIGRIKTTDKSPMEVRTDDYITVWEYKSFNTAY